jgi:ribA/ribD-fused uncharacterized protein
MTDPITAFRDEYAFLSNFFPAPVEYEGIDYPTVEHAYQAAKSLDADVRLKVQKLATPAGAKSAGKRIARRPDWFEVNLPILEALVEQKFTRYPDLGAKLRATGEAELIEGNAWNDRFFGMVQDKKTGAWKGENHLGKMLMRVRANLHGTPQLSSPRSGDVLRDLASATLAFYNRFEFVPQVEDMVRVFQEEVGEFVEAARAGTDATHTAEEAADVIVTVIGLCAAANIDIEKLVEQIHFVTAKNDAKTHATHVLHNGKIRRRSSLS